ncbi:putative toxin-antitoxin system toxin component, PIN family [Parasediminibacterium sp. JCM 36343]|uniref:putative toxin-antitoxin system toxin component, PIN family n=1 Tax=Parasediminibacterium sp. JCM 36343 TaxID=3374279 RepID=UPI00397B8EB3
MPTKLVIDTSVYFTYAKHGKLYRLADAVLTYNLVVFVDDLLIAEVERNAYKITQDPGIAKQIIQEIKEFTFHFPTTPKFSNSPDPKDNFLFDLAIQTNSEVIVTKEKALLEFSESPIAIHDIKWFKENYPVPL